ncbi:hypothetical protein B6N60_03193 [Richelia sinica FACHB-800]|uniref:Family 3 adenylate cyclase n=1 Tax=Richelia sinica FACHB-800 TaxID=1357546 RepID=A0A975TAJ9_9NOST|nr:family 3 adenylate cyclase [Richelia sinica]MBD2663318.1 family 3 adenylate cyclase [Richelia sinica FACHB-800]QXE24488.1 hypothetical protein B6N60_03193 [Richelia sinica FACHB-800]
MNRLFNHQLYSPALFDQAQDIIGCLPIKLIQQWEESKKTPQTAFELLEDYKFTGYSVSSDSAGLTKLTQQQGLIKVLAMINQSKEIVYSFGAAIGGEGIGVWTADNTQMLYPSSLSAERLVSAMMTIQREMNKNCQIKIGMGAHYGDFYLINGGLYGLEADVIEDITENETEGDEIVISQSIYELLPRNHDFKIVQKTHTQTPIGHIFRVLDGPVLTDILPKERKYPIPYSDEFYYELLAYSNRWHDPQLERQLTDKFTQNKAVVLIERESHHSEIHETAMLMNLSRSLILKEIGINLLAENQGQEINVVGSSGIYVFDQAQFAIDFAKKFRQELAVKEYRCRIGIDVGLVVICDSPTGGKQIAGMPINIASKMAQDKGEFGNLYLSQNVKELVNINQCKEIKYTVSGIGITAYIL